MVVSLVLIFDLMSWVPIVGCGLCDYSLQGLDLHGEFERLVMKGSLVIRGKWVCQPRSLAVEETWLVYFLFPFLTLQFLQFLTSYRNLVLCRLFVRPSF